MLGEETWLWGMVENGSRNQRRWDLRRGQFSRRDAKESQLRELDKGKCHEWDGRAELVWGLGRHKSRSHRG